MRVRKGADGPPAGIYRVRVMSAKDGVAKSSGADQIAIVLGNDIHGEICRDWLTSSEKGRGIVLAKLKCLGFDIDGDGDLDVTANDVVDRECYVAVHSVKSDDGRYINLQIDMNASEHCGYWHIDDVPEGYDESSATPF